MSVEVYCSHLVFEVFALSSCPSPSICVWFSSFFLCKTEKIIYVPIFSANCIQAMCVVCFFLIKWLGIRCGVRFVRIHAVKFHFKVHVL